MFRLDPNVAHEHGPLVGRGGGDCISYAHLNSPISRLGLVAGSQSAYLHAYCLMSNHFHLVLETPRPNLAAEMQWLLGSYTHRFNR